MNILFLICGIVAICIGVYGKEFYAGDAFTMSGFKREQRVSTWWGRTIFILVGASFVAAALYSLLTGQSLAE